MRILLDTQAIVWFNLDDGRLSIKAAEWIRDSSHAVLISPASYWEIAIKISLGKYLVELNYEAFWKKGINENGFKILPIELHHTSQLIRLPYHHKDPFDRLLVAQALAEEIALVSSDATLDSYGVQRIW